MGAEANRIVQKLWSTCTVLRDDGLSYGNKMEQLSVLESQYPRMLEHLGQQHGLPGLVVRKAQNKIQDPAKLRHLISDLLAKDLLLHTVGPTANQVDAQLDALLPVGTLDSIDLRSALEPMEANLGDLQASAPNHQPTEQLTPVQRSHG